MLIAPCRIIALQINKQKNSKGVLGKSGKKTILCALEGEKVMQKRSRKEHETFQRTTFQRLNSGDFSGKLFIV